jgi:hypothetical protein
MSVSPCLLEHTKLWLGPPPPPAEPVDPEEVRARQEEELAAAKVGRCRLTL